MSVYTRNLVFMEILEFQGEKKKKKPLRVLPVLLSMCEFTRKTTQ